MAHPDRPAPEYLAVRDKIDGFARAVTARRQADLACRAGCDACCRVQLEVSDVEAAAVRAALEGLDGAARSRLAERLDPSEADPARCVMLEADGRCAIYEARPLVCRTQGHALRYPAGTLEPGAVRAHAGGEITWCPLCYRAAPPGADDVLDAERVDVLLAVVNRRSTERPLRRTALRTLAHQASERAGSRDAR